MSDVIDEKAERRALHRFAVAGATIKFRSVESSEEVSGTGAVLNIGLGGLCFRSEVQLSTDTLLELVLTIPGEKPMRLLGRVRWRGITEGRMCRLYGIEFRRFGTAEGENDPEILSRLIALERKYARSG